MPEKAKFVDYFLLQGGRPTVFQGEDGLYHIVHQYRNDCPKVITHISPSQRGTVIIDNKEYEVALLWEFEGEPCEKRSLTEGGHGYTRHGIEQ